MAIPRMLPRPRHNRLRSRTVVASAAVALFLAGLSIAAVPTGSAGREPRIIALRALADAHVNASTADANYGLGRLLRVDGSPLVRTYVRFSIGNYSGDVRRVNLLLFSRSRSAIGFRVRLATRRWRERRITFENAPRLSSRFVASGPLRAGKWKAVDVTSLVGAADEKEVSLALTTAALQTIELASRETGITGPRLVLEVDVPKSSTTTGESAAFPSETP